MLPVINQINAEHSGNCKKWKDNEEYEESCTCFRVKKNTKRQALLLFLRSQTGLLKNGEAKFSRIC